MKYNSKNTMLAFSSDEEVSRFHDQLTDALRMVMLKAEAIKRLARKRI